MQQDFVTREEAADILEISTRTLDRFVRRRLLRAHRKGRRSYFLAQDIEQLKTVTPAPEVIEPIEHLSNERSNSTEIVPAEPQLGSQLHEDLTALTDLIRDLHSEVIHKDQQIAQLNYQLGSALEKQQNSVPLLESQQQKAADQERINQLQSQHDIAVDTAKRYKLSTLLLGVFGIGITGYLLLQIL